MGVNQIVPLASLVQREGDKTKGFVRRDCTVERIEILTFMRIFTLNSPTVFLLAPACQSLHFETAPMDFFSKNSIN